MTHLIKNAAALNSIPNTQKMTVFCYMRFLQILPAILAQSLALGQRHLALQIVFWSLFQENHRSRVFLPNRSHQTVLSKTCWVSYYFFHCSRVLLIVTGPAPSPRTNTFALGKVQFLLDMSVAGLNTWLGHILSLVYQLVAPSLWSMLVTILMFIFSIENPLKYRLSSFPLCVWLLIILFAPSGWPCQIRNGFCWSVLPYSFASWQYFAAPTTELTLLLLW